MSHASSSSLKRKRNIKSRKIDKRERKMLVSKHSITIFFFELLWHFLFFSIILSDFRFPPIM